MIESLLTAAFLRSSPMQRGRMVLLIAALLLAAGPALAAETVELSPSPAAHDGRVTLEDLFGEAGSGGDVTLASGMAPGRQVVLDAARVQAVAAAHGLAWANADGLSVIIVTADVSGPRVAAGAGFRRSSGLGALTWAHTVQAGDLIRADDLVWSSAASAPLDAPRSAEAVVGRQARHQLRAGDEVSLADIAAAQVIKKNDVVQVVYEADGMKLTLQAKALGAAAVGDTVEVVNTSSKKVIEAIASGPGQALVGPKAEQLKAAARANPNLYASLR